MSNQNAKWIQCYRQAPTEVPLIIGQLPAQLLQKGKLDGSAARSLILALEAISQSEPTHLEVEQFSQQVRQLLSPINLRVMPGEAEAINLLSALDRLDKQVLAQIVRVNCPSLAQKIWDRNIYAVVKAIRCTGNKHAAMLDEILASAWCRSKVTNYVLEAKGS
ncbi:hypothetical protein H6F43_02320 [Leptolyngbya sp. FACHB-36]|uniref:hypothetical protein n=1 Tax=Leptolyngbya sp. FACHB-36 TaxID=2692808 RepID=UPI0016812EC0|nr:hypothetical protein [Leptolyngbya sp. FACHB-36]MBD2019021.1 hypothetical protein [Leptolyngbya sp. FACHB-36]